MTESKRQGFDPLETDTTLKPYRSILESEIRLAEHELKRPTLGLLMSGLLAGLGVGTSLLLLAILTTQQGGAPGGASLALIMAGSYAVGFVLVVMARTDLFTEYTTIALLPWLTGRGRVIEPLRLWVLVYAANLLGAAISALVVARLATSLGVVDPPVLTYLAEELLRHEPLTQFLSATVAGWLMGLLSWLVAAGRDTISQALFVWLVAAIIGLAHLHHAIVGAAEVLAGRLTEGSLAGLDVIGFLLWATLGNAAGGFLFAVMVHYSMVGGPTRQRTHPDRKNRRL